MHLMSIVDQLVSCTPLLVKKNNTVQWKQIIVNLVREVVSSVDPDVKSGDSMDIRPYIKLKIIPGQFFVPKLYMIFTSF